MPVHPQSFSDRDLLRIWERHLTGVEQFLVVQFFLREFGERPGELEPPLEEQDVQVLLGSLVAIAKVIASKTTIIAIKDIMNSIIFVVENFVLPLLIKP